MTQMRLAIMLFAVNDNLDLKKFSTNVVHCEWLYEQL
jgi:hypothetical protein